MENQLDFIGELSDSSTKILEDFYPVLLDHPESALPQEEVVSHRILCSICNKNLITPSSLPSKKRKRTDSVPLCPSMTICEDCYEAKDLGGKDISDKSKRAVKRHQTKKRVQESEAYQQLEEIKNSTTIPESEKKKLQQQIRNRISAQISRDKKKEYIQELEETNSQLNSENQLLKHRLKQLESENKFLKNQLTQIHLGSDESNHFSGKALALALATICCIMVITLSFNYESPQQTRKLIQDFDLSERIAKTPAVQTLPVNDLDSALMKIREKRFSELAHPSSLRALAGPTDPCDKALMNDIRNTGSMTTLYCPKVHAYFAPDSQELKNLQVLIPVDSLPGLSLETPEASPMLELMCKVSEVNVLQSVI